MSVSQLDWGSIGFNAPASIGISNRRPSSCYYLHRFQSWFSSTASAEGGRDPLGKSRIEWGANRQRLRD
jgi:hypothetical protein